MKYDVNKNLSEEQIAERFDWINSNYEINQPFSLEDTEFIRAYASPSTANAPTNNGGISTYDLKFGNSASQSFSKSKTAQGVSIKIAGSVRAEVNVLNHSYGAKYKTTVSSGSSKIKSIRNNVKASAYGMVGTSGTYVGLVHSSSIGATSGSKPTSWSIDKTKEYSASLVVYVYVNAYTTVNTTSGSFDLYAF
nr:hypothetical protein [uncultured Bacillus sp.]